jgi:hypothetical protein
MSPTYIKQCESQEQLRQLNEIATQDTQSKSAMGLTGKTVAKSFNSNKYSIDQRSK